MGSLSLKVVLKLFGLRCMRVTLNFVITMYVHGLKVGFMYLFILQTMLVSCAVGCYERNIASGIMYVIFVMDLDRKSVV